MCPVHLAAATWEPARAMLRKVDTDQVAYQKRVDRVVGQSLGPLGS